MKSTSSIRVAMLGTGAWARRAHLPTLTALPGVEVVACADASPDQAAEVARSFGIPSVYPGLDELLDATPELDLLVIAAPDDVHAPAMRTALARGIAVFCEKPLANDYATATELADLADAAAAPATVGYSFRYSPAVQALLADLESGVLGDVWLIEVAEHNSQFHPLLGKPMNWKGDPDYAAGGALFEYGSHVLDLCLWLLGPVSAVSSDLIRVRPDARLDDIATLQLRFAGGASGTLLCSWLLTGGYPGIRIRLHTSMGLAEVELSDTLPDAERYVRYHPDGSAIATPELSRLADGDTAYTRRHLMDLLGQLTGDHERASTISPTAGVRPSRTLPTVRQSARVQQVLEAALSAGDHWVHIP
ncbi:putative dehydrogenase [Asanoa ferruginea]|uniref:Putative dehydrogenase n=1 Tax=Asanoa ferruginea TaxID=53367 RepID=A0A3D9ZVT2_9ACTN|nr:Gfo/Idh/MocA family oxidoreductase [Asanoa ferruginea]REG01407.1 putative dehydrogenase [Asanoa ferruginea]GIF47968.1 hypothetical protein Afe04nite_25070 [Asanoa ferruginea]